MPNDRYGTVGTGLGAGTGAVWYRYGTDTVRVRYMGLAGKVHGYGFCTYVPYPCTIHTVSVPCTQIAAEIVAVLLLF